MNSMEDDIKSLKLAKHFRFVKEEPTKCYMFEVGSVTSYFTYGMVYILLNINYKLTIFYNIKKTKKEI